MLFAYLRLSRQSRRVRALRCGEQDDLVVLAHLLQEEEDVRPEAQIHHALDLQARVLVVARRLR